MPLPLSCRNSPLPQSSIRKSRTGATSTVIRARLIFSVSRRYRDAMTLDTETTVHVARIYAGDEIAQGTKLFVEGVRDGVTQTWEVTEAEAKRILAIDARFINFFMGKVLKDNKNFDPKVVREIIVKKLEARRDAYLD